MSCQNFFRWWTTLRSTVAPGGLEGLSDRKISHKSDILELDPDAGRWRLVDRMIRERYKHAVSVVEYSEVAQSCS